MKKSLFVLAILAMAGAGSASGQAIALGQDFEAFTSIPPGWSVIDADGDGNCWEVRSGTYYEQSGSSVNVMFSASRDKDSYVAYGRQDNWLVSPRVKVTNNAYVLEFEYVAQDLTYTEPIEVLVSEKGTDTSDFKSIFKGIADNGADADNLKIINFTQPLSAYAGKEISIAIRHTGNQTFGLSVDNFFIYNQEGPLRPELKSGTPAPNGSLEATLVWINPSRSANGKELDGLKINVYRDNEKIATLSDGIIPGETFTWVDKTVSAGQHYYRVSAETSEGESAQSARASVYLGDVLPKAVTKPVAVVNNGVVELGWEPVGQGITTGNFNPNNITYNIYRSVSGSEPVLLASDVKGQKWTDNAPAVGKSTYSVSAVNNAGESAVSAYSTVEVFDQSLADQAVASTTTALLTANRLPDFTSTYSVMQTVFTPADLNYVAGDITKLVYKAYSGIGKSNIPATIYITPADSESLSTWATVNDGDLVFDGSFSYGEGVNDVVFNLNKPFKYEGGNFVVTFIINGLRSGSYTDHFLTTDLGVNGKTLFGYSYSEFTVSKLPNVSKTLSDVSSVRFIIEPQGMATLSGVVINSIDSRAIAGASISVVGVDGLSGKSDAEGNFIFKFLPATATGLNVSATGYKDTTTEIILTAGEKTYVEVKMDEKDNYALSGSVITDDTGLPAAGALVELSGYDNVAVTADNKGAFTIEHVYSGEDYQLKIVYPTYDTHVENISYSVSGTTVSLPAIVLNRSLLPPFSLDHFVAPDGSNVNLQWRTPLDRVVEAGWKSMGDVSEPRYTAGDYYSKNYNVGHYFKADDLADKKMAGLFVTAVRVYIAAKDGEFTAKVWQGDKANPLELAAQTIPSSLISADGGWVTVEFDEPAELREGRSYIIGLNIKGCSNSYPLMEAASSARISGSNDVKWADDYTGLSGPWCIEAFCSVPGTDADIVGNDNAPDCDYNVYRRLEGDAEWTLLNKAPVKITEFSDNGWASIPAGTYRYAVTALYKNGESAKAYSLRIDRMADVDAGVVAFVSPVKSPELREKVDVTVLVQNFGELPSSDIPVVLEVDGNRIATSTLQATLNKGETAELSFGEVGLDEGIHTFRAFTLLDGDDSPANDAAELLLPNLANIDLVAYRWNAYSDAGFMSVQSNNPEGARFLAEVTPNDALITAAECVNDVVYAYTATWYGEPRGMVTVSPTTWTLIESFTNDDDEYDYIIDMTYDASTATMYALRPNDFNGVDLVKVNLEKGETTYVGSIDMIVRTIAADLHGNLFVIAQDGNLYALDAESIETSLVGPTGAGEAYYLQSMAFDHNTERLFWARTSYEANGDIYEVNTSDGSALLLGSTLMKGTEGCELVGLYSPYTYADPSDYVNSVSTDNILVKVAPDGTIFVDVPSEANVAVYNASGVMVANVVAPAGVSAFHFDLASGIYIVRATSASSSASVKAVVR